MESLQDNENNGIPYSIIANRRTLGAPYGACEAVPCAEGGTRSVSDEVGNLTARTMFPTP